MWQTPKKKILFESDTVHWKKWEEQLKDCDKGCHLMTEQVPDLTAKLEG